MISKFKMHGVIATIHGMIVLDYLVIIGTGFEKNRSINKRV